MVMKKITFRADAEKLALARQIAEAKGTTLEEEVRQWLKDLGAGRWKPHAAGAEAKEGTQICEGLKPLRKESILPDRPLKGRPMSVGFTVSLKRYPDTKHKFFRSR